MTQTVRACSCLIDGIVTSHSNTFCWMNGPVSRNIASRRRRTGGTQIMGRWLTWRLIFMRPYGITCFMSPSLCLEFWDCSKIFGKFLHPWTRQRHVRHRNWVSIASRVGTTSVTQTTHYTYGVLVCEDKTAGEKNLQLNLHLVSRLRIGGAMPPIYIRLYGAVRN
jgi:hypothetical protein